MTAAMTLAPPVADTAAQAFLLWAGGMPWAASAASVQTIFRVGPITRVPLAPPMIAGLVNLRGRVVVAISLTQQLFGASTSTVAHSSKMLGVAVEHGRDIYSLLVEDVGDVLSLDAADRVAPPPHVPLHFQRFTCAYYRTARGIVPLLDVRRLVEVEIDRRGGSDRRVTSSLQTGAKS